MTRERTERQKAGDRRRCLNGVRRMTHEEILARKAKYREEVRSNPFRRKLQADYFRKRRERPGMREHINELARARYQKNIEKERARNIEKHRQIMADPERHAAYNAQRSALRHSDRFRMSYIRGWFLPRWERIVRKGREEAYLARAKPENARLFKLWRNNPGMFYQMLESSRNLKRRYQAAS